LQLGKEYVEDVDGDGEITPDDRDFQGRVLPSWIGGILSDLRYKNFSFTFFINIVQGIDRSNGWYNPQGFMVEKTMNVPDLPYWRLDDPDEEFLSSGRQGYSDPGYPPAGSPLLKDASFVRLQNLTLAYEVPSDVISKIKIRRLRVYLNANNLLTFTNWVGWDPEANVWQGFEGSIGQGVVPFPSARTIKFGINLGL
jgi:hypothetical protein